jgi:predicted transcriptional regulator
VEDEYVAIRMITSMGMVRKAFVRSVTEFIEVVNLHRYYLNIYVCLSTVWGSVDATSDKIYRRSVIALDFDSKGEREEYKHEPGKYFGVFNKGCTVSGKRLNIDMVVATGNGCHIYVSIEPTEDILSVVHLTKVLSYKTGADIMVANATQMMRVPCTSNFKSVHNVKPVRLFKPVIHAVDTIEKEQVSMFENDTTGVDNNKRNDDGNNTYDMMGTAFSEGVLYGSIDAIIGYENPAEEPIQGNNNCLEGNSRYKIDDLFALYCPTVSKKEMANYSKKQDASITTWPTLNRKKAFACVHNMMERGAAKGDRNFCLGRIINYLRDVKGCTEEEAFKQIEIFNNTCEQAKNETELTGQFRFYWNSYNYRLLGCGINFKVESIDERIKLEKYCDNCYEATSMDNKPLYIDMGFVTDELLQKYDLKGRGMPYAVLLVLSKYGSMGVDDINQHVQNNLGNSKASMTVKDINRCLKILIDDGLVKKENDIYGIIPTGADNMMINRDIVEAVLSQEISIPTLRAYLCLRRLAVNKQSCAQLDIAEAIGYKDGQGNVSKSLRKLASKGFILINKTKHYVYLWMDVNVYYFYRWRKT